MVKIPSASNIPRAVASGQRQVTSIDTRNFAPTELAQALKGMVDERDRYESSKAESDFLILKNKQDNAYDQDEDYKTIGERYTSSVDKGLAEVSMGITNPRVRAEFLQRNRLRIEQGKERMKGVAFGKEKDFERNSVNDSLNSLREMTLTGSPEDVATARQTVNARLDSAVSMGYYTNEQAGKVKQQWKVDAAIGRLKMMAPKDRVEALKQPWSNDLPSDTRAVLTRDAEKASMAQQAVDTVDEYLLADMDRGEAMEKSGKIEDERLRKEVERRFDYMYGKQQEIETEERAEVFDEFYLPIRQGDITVDDIPADKLSVLTPQQQNSLFNAQASSVGKSRTVSDRATIDTLHGLQQSGRYRELREYFMANTDKLNETSFNQWSKISQKGEMPVEIKSMLSTQQRMTAKLQNAQIVDNTAKSKLSGAMDDWYMNYQFENQGKLPPDDQVDKQMDRLLLEFDTTWWWGGTKPLFQMSDDEKQQVIGTIQEDDPELFKAIADAYYNRGVDPSPEIFLETYQNAKQQRD